MPHLHSPTIMSVAKKMWSSLPAVACLTRPVIFAAFFLKAHQLKELRLAGCE